LDVIVTGRKSSGGTEEFWMEMAGAVGEEEEEEYVVSRCSTTTL